MNKNLQEKNDLTTIRHFKAIFPETLNSNGTLFGGKAIGWMDEIAFITATRFCRQKMITYKINNVKFLKPVSAGSIIEITGKIIDISPARLNIKVEIYQEQVNHAKRSKSIEAEFIMVAVDENQKPIRLALNKVNFCSVNNRSLSSGINRPEY